VWLFEAATRIVPIVPTFCARTTAAAAGVEVGVGVGDAEGDGEAVAAGPLVALPHAASNSAVHGTMMADRPRLRREAITRVGTDEGYG
jgi:hypothetical protein